MVIHNKHPRKVLINGLLLNNEFSGVQYYAENLLKSFVVREKDNFQLSVLLSKGYKGEIPANGLLNRIRTKYDTSNRFYRIYYENLQLSNYLKRNDIYHSTGYVLPFFFKIPSVLTIHDLIALQFPEYCQYETAIYFRLLLPASIRKATQIIVPSNKIKEGILAKYTIDPGKIHVVYHGIGDHFKKVENIGRLKEVRMKYNLPGKFILFVGNIEPKKNLVRLINAYHQLRKEAGIKHQLVIVGKKGWKYEPVFQTINKLKLNHDILMVGYVAEEDLPVIYTLSGVFVFPSLYEGFGFPPLEAMACEVPTLVSNQGSLPEVTGGNCLQVDPFDVDAISKGIYKLVHDENYRKYSIVKGKSWIKKFTWKKTAEETIKVYNKIL